MPRVTDMFTTALQRDVFHKTRDDVGNTFTRVLTNFSKGPLMKGEVVYPAIYALAWILRGALLAVREQQGDTVYRETLAVVLELTTARDTEEYDG